MPLFLATLAIRQQNRVIRFRSAAEMLAAFGMQQGGTQYRRLMAAFQRIFGATIFFGTDTQRERVAKQRQGGIGPGKGAAIGGAGAPCQLFSPSLKRLREGASHT